MIQTSNMTFFRPFVQPEQGSEKLFGIQVCSIVSPLEVMNTSCLHKTRQKTTEEIVDKIHNVSSIRFSAIDAQVAFNVLKSSLRPKPSGLLHKHHCRTSIRCRTHPFNEWMKNHSSQPSLLTCHIMSCHIISYHIISYHRCQHF